MEELGNTGVSTLEYGSDYDSVDTTPSIDHLDVIRLAATKWHGCSDNRKNDRFTVQIV